MKRTFVNLIILLPFLSYTQTNYNEMTVSEYYNITFNNIPISQLSNFQGSMNDLALLFDTTFIDTCNDPEGEAKTYKNNNIVVSYFGYPPNMELAGINILNSNITVNINTVNVKIGDNLSLLGYGSVGFNSFSINSNSNIGIAIFKPEYEDSYVKIEFNISSGVINKIMYISPS